MVEATINPKILSGIIDYLTAATYNDIDLAAANFNEISQEISPLLHSFFDYHITRIDYCVNISLDEFILECDPMQIMNLIKKSNIPHHYEEWMKYDNISHRMKSRPESFYLKSNSVTINYYSKYLQLLNKSQENVKKGYPQSIKKYWMLPGIFTALRFNANITKYILCHKKQKKQAIEV